MPPAGFKPATPASNRLQTLSLDRSANGIDQSDIVTLSITSTQFEEDVSVHLFR
jgi:hypothetical protein